MSQDWHWLDKKGVQRLASAQQLTDAILDGVVSPDAPVWRAGMSTFLPASRVPTFALPAKNAGSRTASSADLPGSPAPPSAEATAALQRTLERAKNRRPPAGPQPSQPAASTPAASKSPHHHNDVTTRPLGSLRAADTSRPPARPAMPDQSGQVGTLIGMTPHPPLHAPAPVAAAAARATTDALKPSPADDSRREDPLSEVLGPAPARTEPPPAIASVEVDRFEDTPPATPIARDSRRVVDPAPSDSTPLPGPLPTPALWSPPDTTSGVDVIAIPVRRSNPDINADAPSVIVAPPSVRPPEPSRADQTQRTKALRPRRFLVPVVAVVAAIAMLGLVGVGINSLRSPASHTPVGKPAASSVAAASSPAAVVTAPAAASTPAPTVAPTPISSAPCTFRGSRKRIVVGASKDVPIEVWATSTDPRVAAGFAAKSGAALGFVLDPGTLEPKRSFSEKASSPIRRVVPTRSGDTITFAVDTADPQAALKNTLTVASTPPLKLGTFKDALTIESVDSTVPEVLWTLPTDKPLEAMRAAVVPSRGMAVVFRMDSGVWLGWVTEDRKVNGKLARIPGTGAQVGTPSIAWNGKEMLVAFADLPTRDGSWAIRLARIPYGAEPAASEPWTVPVGGPGGPAIAPSVFGLADGRWIIVWTEGSSGARDVRVQTYDSTMKALGEAFTVSEAGANAGQGVAAVGSAGGVVMYLSVLGKMYEVWGASIECP